MAYDAFISYSHAADGRLAPAVQTGLQRLARPWYKVRALRVFRDDTGLAVNPHLWASIATAMEESSYFVLMASPDAASSPWVNREIEHWCATKNPDHILPVLTEGTLTWDGTLGDYDPAVSTALPAALAGRFADEPRHLDLRWARDETELDLRHSKFREAVADLAAPIHGVAKEELESEDVRRHRRALALARTGVMALLLFALAAVLASVFAIGNAHKANAAASRARRAAARATAAAAREHKAKDAEASAAKQAREASAEAQQQAELAANQRDLAQRARVDADEAALKARLAEGDATAQAARAEAARKRADAAATAAHEAADEADRQRDLATDAANIANLERVAAQQQRLAGVARQLMLGSDSALKDGNVDRALLLAMEAERFAQRSGGLAGVNVQQPLVDALQHDPALIGYLQGLSGQITDVAMSPDGSRAAAVATSESTDETQVGIWSLPNRELLATLPNIPTFGSSVTFVDARTLLVGSDCAIDVFRAIDAGTTWTRGEHWAPWNGWCPGAVAVAPTGTVIVAVDDSDLEGGALPRVYVLTANGVVRTNFEIGAGGFYGRAVAGHGARFAITDGPRPQDPPNTLGHVYTTNGAIEATLRPTLNAAAGYQSVTDLRFSGDDSHLVMLVGGADPPVHRIDLATGADDASPPPSGSWNATVPSYPIGLSPDLDRVVQRNRADDPTDATGDLLAVGYLGSGSLVRGIEAPLDRDVCHACETVGGEVAFAPDGQTFVTSGGKNGVPVFASPEYAHPPLPTTYPLGSEVAFSAADSRALAPDRSFVAIVQQAGPDGNAALFLEPLTPTRRRFTVPLPTDPAGPNAGGAESVAFGTYADVVAIGFSNGAIEFVDLSSGAPLLRLDPVRPCDEDYLAGGCHVSFAGTMGNGHIVQATGGNVHIWDIAHGTVVGEHDFLAGIESYGVRLSPSGTRLVVLNRAPDVFPNTVFVLVYDGASNGWTQRRTLVINESVVSVSPDGRRLAAADGTRLVMYDLDSGQELWSEVTPISDSGIGADVRFSQDSQTLYVLSHQFLSQGTSLVWLVESKTGAVRSTVATAGNPGGIVAVFERENHVMLVADSRSHMFRAHTAVFDSPLTAVTDLDAAGCSRAGRNLTLDEWISVVGTADPYERTCTG